MEALGGLAWGAGAGAIGGLAYALWVPPPRGKRIDVTIFLMVGLILTAMWFYSTYIGDPDSRSVRKLGFVGPFFLAGAIVAWLAGPLLRRGPRRRPPSADP